jgi:hypothetical protein
LNSDADGAVRNPEIMQDGDLAETVGLWPKE